MLGPDDNYPDNDNYPATTTIDRDVSSRAVADASALNLGGHPAEIVVATRQE